MRSFLIAALPILRNPQRAWHLGVKLFNLWQEGGFAKVRDFVINKSKRSYRHWTAQYLGLSDLDRKEIRRRIERLPRRPRISVLMPVYNTDEEWLRKAIDSVRAQLYPDWELCIADDRSTRPNIRPLLEDYARTESRIRVSFRDQNGHISASSNTALGLVTGEFTALLDHDDELVEHALYTVAEELSRHPEADLIYSDENKISVDGELFDPNFKPDWNPDLLLSQNYVCHLGVYRTSLLREIGGFRLGFEGSQDYDLLLRFVEKTRPERIRHIPHVLYHWRAIPGSVALRPDQKNYAHVAARKALRSHMDRLGIPATVTQGLGPLHRVRFPLPTPAPKVSAIICTRDQVKLLRDLVDDLLRATQYENLEVLVVDNQSREPETLAYFETLRRDCRFRILKYDAPFNYSAMNNLAAREAQGEVLALLNNDLRVIHEDWLDEMVSQAIRPGIGAVGAKLYYPDNTVQHAGIALGVGGIANHPHRRFHRSDSGFTGRLNCIQNVTAVTGACLTVRRDRYLEVGGMDEAELPVAFNDVDLCLRLHQHGYRNLFTPFAELHHLESASRGSDLSPENRERLDRESEVMLRRWKPLIGSDPLYNPNLTVEKEDFSPAFPPRKPYPWRAAPEIPG